jgi:hypothetical protein
MVEKFSDYEGTQYLKEEGEFVFEIMNAELQDSKAGTPMVVLELKCDKGVTTVRHSLNPKARWSYNNLIRAALKLNDETAKTFELDYETVHQQLIGKKIVGNVETDTYTKEVKKPNDDGTFTTTNEEKISYKVTSYQAL